MVTQFRVLARFAWPFFWLLNITGVVLIVYAWNKFREVTPRMVIVMLLGFLLFDAKNAIEFTKKFHWQTPNLYEQGQLHDAMQRLTKQVDPKKYQAFLPIPYFTLGSEDYAITIDPDDHFITGCMNFSLKTGLPMMASSMGRTPPEFTKHELSIFLNGQFDHELKSKLNEKPILILYNSVYYSDSTGFGGWPPVKYEPALTAFKNGKNIITERSLIKIAEEGMWILYESEAGDL